MNHLVKFFILLGFVSPASVFANSCPEELTSKIPRGTQSSFSYPLGGKEYKEDITAEILKGNIPRHILDLKPVNMATPGKTCKGSSTVTVCAMPEPIAVGPDSNYNHAHMSFNNAAEIARAFGMVLPTPAMSDATHRAAKTHITPNTQTWLYKPPIDGNRPFRFKEQNGYNLADMKAAGHTDGDIVSGIGKDYVLRNSSQFESGSNTRFTALAQYGWHKSKGSTSVWQPADHAHGGDYIDYSLIPRFYSQWVKVGNDWHLMSDLLADSDCASIINGNKGTIRSSLVQAFQNPTLAKPIGGLTNGFITQTNETTIGDIPSFIGTGATRTSEGNYR